MGVDVTKEALKQELITNNLHFSNEPEYLAKVDFYIVAVPTPIDNAKNPDLSKLINATDRRK